MDSQMELTYSAVAAGFGFLACVFLTYALGSPAKRFGLVDVPDYRKFHDGTIPLTGGVAMFLSFISVATLFNIDMVSFGPFIAATLLLIGIGVLDDVRDVKPRWRFIVQCLAVLIMCFYGNIVLHNVGDLFFTGTITLGWLAIPFTVFAVVGAINAANMADGVDGLAGGLILLTFSALAYITWDANRIAEFQVLTLLGAVVLGFLVWNARSPWRKRAAAFMGDSGSTFLGLAVAWYIVQLSQGSESILAPVTGLWLFALPIMDTLRIMLRRLRKGTSPFRPGRDHLHHIIQDAGYSAGKTASIIWLLGATLALVGIFGHKTQLSDGVMFVAFLVVFAVYLWAASPNSLAGRIARRRLMITTGQTEFDPRLLTTSTDPKHTAIPLTMSRGARRIRTPRTTVGPRRTRRTVTPHTVTVSPEYYREVVQNKHPSQIDSNIS